MAKQQWILRIHALDVPLQSMSLPAGKRLSASLLSQNYLYLYLLSNMAPMDADARSKFLAAKFERTRFPQWSGMSLLLCCKAAVAVSSRLVLRCCSPTASAPPICSMLVCERTMLVPNNLATRILVPVLDSWLLMCHWLARFHWLALCCSTSGLHSYPSYSCHTHAP